MQVDEALTSRRSVRAFLPTPVSRATVEHILTVAARAPSGTNMQPWKVYVVAGAAKQAITDEVQAARAEAARTGETVHTQEHRFYPPDIGEPYITRRRKVGWDMYGLLGIQKGDKDKMFAQHGRNFEFFGAPVGLFVFIERHLEIGSWLDLGMFLENIMIAAREQGLHTCPQAAWTNYHKIVRAHVGAGESEELACGMCLGEEDTDAAVNTLTTERAPVDEFARFVGFD
jgi:nitroreductase